MAIHAALLLSLLETVALAGVLLHWADRVAGARLLVAYLLGVAIWIVGNELPTWTGSAAEDPALMLLATAPLTSAVFLHFALAFTRCRPPLTALAGIYGIGLIATLLSVILRPGDFEPFAGLKLVAVPNKIGWAASVVWVGLAGAGLLVLARGFVRGRDLERRQVAAVMASGGWGLACMSGYAIVALHLPIYPWPLVGLPLYPIILVYGVLRYRVLVANAWARRALIWTLLVAVGGVLAAVAGSVVPLLALPGSAWISGAVAAGAVLVLGGPVRRLAERVVYPGRTVAAEDLRRWRSVLAVQDDFGSLRATAERLVSEQVNMPVVVSLGVIADPNGNGEPILLCQKLDGIWGCSLFGWEAAPPGVRRLAGFFADLLAEQATRVDGFEASRAAERERQHRDRLAELGALAATVAHDVRNPLNTISMAVAFADADTRREVGEQVRRVARLADDLLDYARPWHIDPVPLDIADVAIAAPFRSDGSRVLADPRQLRRVLDNLLDNARLAGANRVEVEVEGCGTTVQIRVLDDGFGIPSEIRGRVFQPFVSRRVGGTGLGLAIVARIMEAHGGAVAVEDRPGWTTCFALTLPVAP